MTQRDEVQKFEQGRIRFLQEERLHIQKKTFTKWMNSFLQKARLEVEDLFTDLADGKKLLKLLEIISGEKLGKPNNGKMRVHKIENVNKSLAFLHTKVRLESIGAEDIVDGNPRLILGLLWTIILRFQIQEIEIDVDEENENSEKKSAKDALLLWAQRKTHGYAHVHINDFTTSWRSGLGFNALIHSHRPDLFDYNTLQPQRHIDNLNHAFDVANDELGIPRLLDAEDIDNTRPDEKSIMTYVASYYHTFARMKNEAKSGRRIAKIINQMVEADKMKLTYDRLTSNLLEWIKSKTVQLEDRNLPNSLEDIQSLLHSFGSYRNQEKPPKYKERIEIEVLYFQINTQLKELKQPAFIPVDGKLIQDIERTWEVLERAEHNRELALRNELSRQQRLEQLNYKFERKSILREGYLNEMIQVLSDPRYGSNLVQVDATVKKHEAISADILARKERFHDLSEMCSELVGEKYRDSTRVQMREAEVLGKWNQLLKLLEKHKINLNQMENVMSLLREIDSTLTSIQQLKTDLSSLDTGMHLLAVEELLHKHALQDLQVTSLGENVRKLKRIGEQIAVNNPKEEVLVRDKLKELTESYSSLKDSSILRKVLLEDARNFYQFLQDHEDEEGWLIEKERICQTGVNAKDLAGVLTLQQKHKLLQDEIKSRRNKYQTLLNTGSELIKEKHPRVQEIQVRIEGTESQWGKLDLLVAARTQQLQDAAEAFQFYADANEADSWLNEKTSIVSSKDYGSDEPSAQALLQRHKDLEGELNAYQVDINSLNLQAEKLITNGNSLELTEPIEETTYEYRLVPKEIWENELVETIEHRTHIEERIVPQVKALYPFARDGFHISTNEVLFLLNKTNRDWWSVRKADGVDGFAPANYVQEIESRVIQIQVRRPEKVRTSQKVKKTKMIKEKVPVKVLRTPKHQLDNNQVVNRLRKINETYQELQEMAVRRRALLEDAIRLFRFYKECDDFEKWINDKEKLLMDDADTVEQSKRKFEQFLTDLSTSNKRIETLDLDVKQFEKQKHSQIDKVRSRHRHIHTAWQRLNKLKAEKERNLEGASSVQLFQRTCDEARDWMYEKMTQLDCADVGPDLKTVQALQRRHENLERELAPVQEKVKRVTLLANSVKNTYPHEQENVTKKEGEINQLWSQVKDKAVERRNRLENAVGQQIFDNSSKVLLTWVADVKEQLNADTTARDVQTALNLLKNHQDLLQDIKAHQDEFTEVSALGKQLLKSNPNLVDVSDKLNRLNAEQAAIVRGWMEKDNWLQQLHQLQTFNKEADNIDATTSSHQAFLEFNDLGKSLDEVEALCKQHQTFENTLMVQEERLNAFNERANQLILSNHYDETIDEKRNQVLQKRKVVKDLCQLRTHALEASKNYQEFCAQVQDLRVWLMEKVKTASDESYRDLNNLERKLQKHEAFERELRANEGQLRTVNKLGQALIAQDNYRKDDVAKTLFKLNEEWKELVGISLDKGRRLRQAVTEHDYNTSLEDVSNKLDEIDGNLKNNQVGVDLRSCKELLKKHEVVEGELTQCTLRIDDLVSQSEEMTHDDHFNASMIQQNALGIQKRLKDLDTPTKRRRDALAEGLKYHKFAFELDSELQWIKEREPLVNSDVIGQNLYQAQTFYKKHKKLEAEIVGHQVVIDKTLENGQILIDQNHPEQKMVQELCSTLQEAWNDLEDKSKKRLHKLELSLKAQQFFFEANEVESWLSEKSDILANTEYGRDRDSATKLLTKHKALELELDTYKSIIAEMGRGSHALVQSGHPESKAISERQSTLEHLVRSLQRRATIRQQRLMESLFRHEYFLESTDLEHWIIEQTQQASSEDYGQDYEHLLILQGKFDDFTHSIESGTERFNQCENLAQKLIGNENPYTNDIMDRQKQLRESWNKLHSQMENRKLRLYAAGEIHRFHRDVADALSRIHEKNAALGTEVGRDLNSSLSLLRKQEAFENELVALESQLQVLVDDGTRLQTSYASNKSQLQTKQELVIEAWEGLKERADLRRDQLQASVDLQKFLSYARDLTGWSSSLRISMNTEENIRSIARAQSLKAEHEALRIEIEARETNFQHIMEMSETMKANGHYASKETIERCANLFEERDKLHVAWQLKKVRLDQLIDLLLFLREAKQIETICCTQEMALGNELAETIDDVRNQLRKHDALEKVIQGQDERIDNLVKSAEKLITQRHYESKQISDKVTEVQSKRLDLLEVCARKRILLEGALLYAEFTRDVSDTQMWISEREKKLQMEIKTEDISNLENKMKKLQKHQAFQAEVAANESRIQEIKHKAVLLIQSNHKATNEIRTQLKQLEQTWMRLLYELDLHFKGLEEAQDILEFNNQLDKMEAWIRDKEIMIQAGDLGRDYEHCQALERKLDDVDSDMRVDDTRIKNINQLADKLTRQGHKSVEPRRNQFINKWQNLQGALGHYREKLAGALDVHLFNRDVADTLQRINEKSLAMEVEDLGRDLNTVELLQRKQEALESEMTAVANKIKEHDKDSYKLGQRYPESNEHLKEQMHELDTQWNSLNETKERRHKLLKNAYVKQKFLNDVKDLELWSFELIKRMKDTSNPTSVSEAEALLELHNERKAEIDGRQDVFVSLIETARQLDSNNRVEELQKQLNQQWIEHKHELINEYQLQEFKEQADQIDNWLGSKEAFLNNDDLGDSPRAVELLMRKHSDFEKMLNQQMARINDFRNVAKSLTDNQVNSRLQNILDRRTRLLKSCQARKKKLEESQSLYEFRRNINEVDNWLVQKIQIANDDNYLDSSNLQSKIQKHMTFDAEILANRNRIQSISDQGLFLINQKHFAIDEIQERLNNLEEQWKRLGELSQLKRERLNDAYQALLFDRSLDEFITWLDNIDLQLQSTDCGQDLITVNNLLKKHTVLENDVLQHTENCEQINDSLELFIKNNHFMLDKLKERAERAIARFHQLHEPMQVRRDLLESSSLFHQFARDIDDELSWLIEREPLVNSQDLGRNLVAVQSLQKKHYTLETELASREPIVSALVSRSAHLISAGHTSSTLIETKANQLKEKLIHVRDLASVRKLRLQDALESQMFYAEIAEAETWLNDKKPMVVSNEIGRDEESAQALQRKLEALSCETNAFESTIMRLSMLAKDLNDRQHFDANNIMYKQKQVEGQFKELEQLMQQREKRLSEALSYFSFLRECTEIQEWMNQQQTKAASEDYGTDVEHVELLIQTFETFLSSLNNSEQRVMNSIILGNNLISFDNEHTERIMQKITDIKDQWDDLMELAQARHEALAGAKQVHIFDRTADETIAWIIEKNDTLALEAYEQDLESIQALVRKHNSFENELLAVKEQVDAVQQEAKRLSLLFPDAEEHIDVKREDTLNAWNELERNAHERRNKLQQSEQLQVYFDQYHDLVAWISEMLAKVTAPELSQDVHACEILIEQHKEHKVEIDARADIIKQFYLTGNNLIEDKHILSDEIQERIKVLQVRMEHLNQTWDMRRTIYEQNLDVQLFKREANLLENWMLIREGNLHDDKLGGSIIQVEDLIRKHDDFEKTIEAQEDKFNALERITLVEDSFNKQKQIELHARQLERDRLEQERSQRKRIELARVTEKDINGDTNLNKSNSISYMFGDKIKREGVKRAESMKVSTISKPLKKTPSFTTRRRPSSFRSKSGTDTDLPPVELQEFLERKQVLAGGKRAQNRAWKNCYAVLCGQLLCFFKNKDDFIARKAIFSPLGIHNAICTIANDYQKRKHTFRLKTSDGSEFLFACNNETNMTDWINKISFRSKLPPSQQLINLELHKDVHEVDQSSQSSRTSSPDIADTVVLRHDPQFQNGNSQRHSVTGESPPPLPITDPPNNRPIRRHSTLEGNHGYGESSGGKDWQSPRASLSGADHKKSSRIMDLFRKKRHAHM